MKPALIVIEGIDGSGTTTQSQMLVQWMKNQKIPAILAREPTDQKIGKLIRESIFDSGKMAPESLALLFAADRVEHCNKIIQPNLENGVFVVSDRYFLSSIVYQSIQLCQSGKTKDPINWLKIINQGSLQETITIVLKVDPAVAIKRIRDRSSHRDMFETETFIKKTAGIYEQSHKILTDRRIVYVDGNQEQAMVFADMLKVIGDEKILPTHRHS